MTVFAAEVLSELTPAEMRRALMGLPKDQILALGVRADHELANRNDGTHACSWCASSYHDVDSCPVLRAERKRYLW